MLESQTFTYVDRHGLEPEPIFIVTRVYDTPSSLHSQIRIDREKGSMIKERENAIRKKKKKKKKRVER